MREYRRFTRVRPSGRVPRVGKIIVDMKAPAIDCNVVDVSAGGACLEVWGEPAIPKRFELLHGGTRKKCSVVWKSGRRLGVLF